MRLFKFFKFCLWIYALTLHFVLQETYFNICQFVLFNWKLQIPPILISLYVYSHLRFRNFQLINAGNISQCHRENFDS